MSDGPTAIVALTPAPGPSPASDPWEHHKPLIRYLIRSTDGFIVYIDKQDDIEWETTNVWEATLDLVQVGAIQNRITVMKALPWLRLDAQARRSFHHMMGEATARILEKDSSGAQALLDQAQEFVLGRLREVARIWYLSAAASTVLFVSAMAWPVSWVLALLFKISDETSRNLMLGLMGGAVGALLSVLLRSKDTELNASAGKAIHFIDGTSRSVMGAMGGALVIAAVHARIVVPDLTGGAMLGLLALAGGFSERWVPNLIEKVEVALLNSKGELQPPVPPKNG
jgi:hypothetical protein